MCIRNSKYIYKIIKSAKINNNELYIGDNEIVSKLLVSENRKYDVIYMDPPYNASEFKDGQMETRMPENIWIKKFTNLLKNAKELLSNTGVIFISINDQEVAETKIICNKILGKKNFMAQIVRKRTNEMCDNFKVFARVHEYILVYAKNAVDIYTNWKKEPLSTWWDDTGYDSDANEDIKDMFGGIIFDYSKPIKLMEKILSIFDKNKLSVLDLYAGSGTTAQAILAMNNFDNRGRKFTLVQKKEIYKGTDVSEICLQRIKRSIEKYDVNEGCIVYKLK